MTRPLIRKPGVPKDANDVVDPADPSTHFREASWDEALDLAAAGFRRIRDEFGGRALAGFGSAKGSNEEAYLFQKLVRTGFGDQQRRPLHEALPRVVGRRPDGDDRLGSGHRAVLGVP